MAGKSFSWVLVFGLVALLLAACSGSSPGFATGGAGGSGTGGMGGATGPACSTSDDCPSDMNCARDVCRPRCTSASQCEPLGLFCDLALSACVNCIAEADCPAGNFCDRGSCAPDVCKDGSSVCDGNGVMTCNSVGSGYRTTVACPTMQTCIQAQDVAACQPWVCTPAATECQGRARIVCAADGMSIVQSLDCATTGQFCVAGTCQAQLCAASTVFCNGNEIHQCSADGQSSTLIQACGAGYYCNGATVTCAAQICSPTQAACNGNLATTCNAQGSGYAAGGIDCSTSGLVCSQGSCASLVCSPNTRRCSGNAVMLCAADGMSESVVQTCVAGQYCNPGTSACATLLCNPGQGACDGNVATTCNSAGTGYTGTRTDCTQQGLTCGAGVCTTCPGGNGAIGSVRISELNIGATDYVAIRNTSPQCPANIAGLAIEMRDQDSVGYPPIDFPLPSMTLAPGQSVYIYEYTAGATGDINVGANIGFTPSRGGWAALCTMPCTLNDLNGVVDAVSFNVPPAFPAPVTFTSALVSITSGTQDTDSYQRAAYNGTAPNFVSSDWTVAAKTRP